MGQNFGQKEKKYTKASTMEGGLIFLKDNYFSFKCGILKGIKKGGSESCCCTLFYVVHLVWSQLITKRRVNI